MSEKKTGRPAKYTEAQVKEGIRIVEDAGEVPTGDTVKRAMCDHLTVAGGINAQSLDKEVRRLLEERVRQRRDGLIAALPPATLDAAKEIGSLVEAAVLEHMGEQHHALRSLAGKKAASLNIDLDNQREQIRELLSRIERKDEEIAELEVDRQLLQEQFDMLSTEARSLRERVAVLEREEDIGAKMLAMMEEKLGQRPVRRD